jgi:hypothetical protein
LTGATVCKSEKEQILWKRRKQISNRYQRRKKIIEQHPQQKAENPTAVEGVSTTADWRGLAQMVQQETDSHKMIHLVQQLIAKYDEEKLRSSPAPAAPPPLIDPTG